MVAMVISYVQGNKSLKGVIGASFQALAFETAEKIDFILKEKIKSNSRLANHPTIILAAKGRRLRAKTATTDSVIAEEAKMWENKDARMQSLIENGGSRVLKSFLKEDNQANASTLELFVTDDQGTLVSSINFFPDYQNSHHEFWKKAIQGKKGYVYIGGLYKDPKLDDWVFHLAVPIRNFENITFGVFHRIYLAKQFFSSFIEPIVFGETGHVMMINSEGIVVDCPILPTGTKLPNPELVRAVTGPEPSWAQTQGDGHGSEELSIIGYSPLPGTNKIIKASSGQKFYTFAWQSSQELFAPTQNLFFWISAAGAFSVVLIVVMGSVASNKLVRPILLLQTAAARIGRGEDVQPLKIQTGDEIESLANQINVMNKMLRKSFSGLENQVREKTSEVLYLKEYTESILMSVPDVILIFDQELKVEFANLAFEKLVGATSDSVHGKALKEINFEYADRWEFLAGELFAFFQGNDVKTFKKISSIATRDDKPRDPLAPKEGGSEQVEPQNSLTLGDRVFGYQFFNVAIQEEKNRRIGVLLREISEQKFLQDQLAMAEKLSGLGTLASGIAHEMNNPLFSIMGFTEAILDEKNPEKINSYASKVLDRAKHMASIILNLAGYTRSSGKDEVKDVNLNERLDAAIEIAMMASYSNDINLEKDYEALPLFKAKPEEIQQIFVNIITNAVQAMEGTGTLTISSKQENDSIVTRIQDTGPGIAQDHLSRVFDPFFTTKDQGKGTGLGLNIVHRLVDKYRGKIEVDSKLGIGCVFTTYFPVKSQSNLKSASVSG